MSHSSCNFMSFKGELLPESRSMSPGWRPPEGANRTRNLKVDRIAGAGVVAYSEDVEAVDLADDRADDTGGQGGQ